MLINVRSKGNKEKTVGQPTTGNCQQREGARRAHSGEGRIRNEKSLRVTYKTNSKERTKATQEEAGWGYTHTKKSEEGVGNTSKEKNTQEKGVVDAE